MQRVEIVLRLTHLLLIDHSLKLTVLSLHLLELLQAKRELLDLSSPPERMIVLSAGVCGLQGACAARKGAGAMLRISGRDSSSGRRQTRYVGATYADVEQRFRTEVRFTILHHSCKLSCAQRVQVN